MWIALALLACSGTEDDTGSVADVDITELFTNLQGADEVSCTLTDGSTSTCWELTFTDTNPDVRGPYCPETIDDVGGLGVYDGTTSPGFHQLDRELFEAMETDGFDIVNPSGNIRVLEGMDMPTQGLAYCLEQPSVDYTMVYRIPIVPIAATQHTIASIEDVGVQLDGIPITGAPPSVVSGPFGSQGYIPALDPCGGHEDPAGYYHAHLIPDSIGQVLDAYGYDDVSCDRVTQASGVLVGFAKDGYPIYSADPSVTDLDACNGTTGPTDEFPDGVYHYLALSDAGPNVPPCLTGAYPTSGTFTNE